MSGLPPLGPSFTPELAELIRLVTIASRDDIWSDSDVADAKARLVRQYGRVPSLDDLASRFGEDVVIEVAKSAIEARHALLLEASERFGIGAKCHLCQRSRNDGDPTYEFGLARILDHKKNWAGAAGMLALNIVTMPLGVAVGPRRIGSTTTAQISRCKLVSCRACSDARRGFFGGIKFTHADCRKHPSYDRLVREGFDTFLSNEELAGYR